ncbi:MAG: glycine cleavage T C-terminal barrel domain-containing protein [Gemmataceae bacterium]
MSMVLFDFTAHATVEVSGEDARTFLHNLSTQDIRNLPPEVGVEAFFLTATAKVIAQAWIWRQAPRGKTETLWLDLPPGQSETLLTHLRKHIIGEDVEVIDHTASLARLYLVSDQEIESSPELLTSRTREDGVTLRRRDLLGRPGYDLLGPPEAIAQLRATMQAQGATFADEATFQVWRIEAGLPWWGADIDATTFAPETGRIPQAISYSKGCYLGQEPVVMARDRGVVQRQLVGLELGDQPAIGPLTHEGIEVGRVSSAAFSPRLGRAIGLGYAKRAYQAPGTRLHLGERQVTVTSLPFLPFA